MLNRRTCLACLAVISSSIWTIHSSAAHEIRKGNLVIEHPWSRQSPMAADVAAGFMTITNHGADDDRLVSATAEIAPTVQLHSMKLEGEVMRMFELPDGITIPAGKSVTLKPKSLHIMFMGIKSQPVQGASFKGTLTFEKAGPVEVEYEVEASDSGM